MIFSTRRKIEGVDSRSLEDAVYAFGFGQQCSYVKPFGEGHINETYAVYMPGADGKDTPLYVLQRINIWRKNTRMYGARLIMELQNIF